MNIPSIGWTVLEVFRKEVVDALRETRTLLIVLGSALLVGPMAAGFMLTSVPPEPESQPRVEVLVAGIEHAPGLGAYLRSQHATILPAPPGHEAALRAGTLPGPVVAVPIGFEAALARGEAPAIGLLEGAGGQDAEIAAARIHQLLEGYVRDRANAGLASRGLDARVIQPVRIEQRQLAEPRSPARTFASVLPFLLLMSVLFGALNAALDTTCGERERDSLDALLTTPSHPGAIVLGKWAAVVAVSALVAVLSCLSLMLTQSLLGNARLDSMLHFGPREALQSLLLMLPFAAALPAVLMATAVRCRTFKEAQANSNLVILLLSVLPVVTVIATQAGEAPWQLWTPVLAQMVLIGRVLNGEPVGALQMLVPLLVCIAITAVGVMHVARNLRPPSLSTRSKRHP